MGAKRTLISRLKRYMNRAVRTEDGPFDYGASGDLADISFSGINFTLRHKVYSTDQYWPGGVDQTYQIIDLLAGLPPFLSVTVTSRNRTNTDSSDLRVSSDRIAFNASTIGY